MPRNSYQNLLRYLHFVNNDSVNTQDKLAQIRPLISMGRVCEDRTWRIQFSSQANYCFESKVFVYQTIQSKKKNKKVGIKKSCLRWYLWFYLSLFDDGWLDNEKFGHLQKCAQVYTKLCDNLRRITIYRKIEMV